MRNEKKLKKIAKQIKNLEYDAQNGGDRAQIEIEITELISGLSLEEILYIDNLVYEEFEN